MMIIIQVWFCYFAKLRYIAAGHVITGNLNRNSIRIFNLLSAKDLNINILNHIDFSKCRIQIEYTLKIMQPQN